LKSGSRRRRRRSPKQNRVDLTGQWDSAYGPPLQVSHRHRLIIVFFFLCYTMALP
jgi:hypothetical protein